MVVVLFIVIPKKEVAFVDHFLSQQGSIEQHGEEQLTVASYRGILIDIPNLLYKHNFWQNRYTR